MITIAVAASKGGNAKTSLCVALATYLESQKHKVAIVDLDASQESLTIWKFARGNVGPTVTVPKVLGRDLRRLEVQGYEYAICDTPPALDMTTAAAIKNADRVLVPCRQSLWDLVGVEGVVELCHEHKKPFGIVLTDVSPDWKAINKDSAAALGKLGDVFKSRLTHRPSYVTAPAEGKAAWEIDKVALQEVSALWKEVAQWIK